MDVQPKRAIAIVRRAISKLQVAPNQLTSLHGDLFLVCAADSPCIIANSASTSLHSSWPICHISNGDWIG